MNSIEVPLMKTIIEIIPEPLGTSLIFLSGFIPWVILIGTTFLYKNHYSLRNWLYFFSILFLAIAVCDSSTSLFFKNIFQRLRPCRLDELKTVLFKWEKNCAGRFGFFSSHASNAACITSYFFSLLPMKISAKVSLLSLVFLISLSRILLGAHFPTDILAGWLWGSLIGWYFTRELKKILKGQDAQSSIDSFPA